MALSASPTSSRWPTRRTSDSAQLVADLYGLGIKVKLVTGDALPTAQTIATGLGTGARPATVLLSLRDRVSSPCIGSQLRENLRAGDTAQPGSPSELCDVYAEVFPEDKLCYVDYLRSRGAVVGRTGDGVKKAPALSKEEVGVVVVRATDVAKDLASLVLTTAGIDSLVAGCR